MITHPGEILRAEFLTPLRMSANALALALHIPYSLLSGILAEKRAVSVDTAMRLGRYFGTATLFWMNLQVAHDLSKAEADTGSQIKEDVRPREPAQKPP